MDCFSLGLKRRMKKSNLLMKMIIFFEYQRVKKYESTIYDFFNIHTIISEFDQKHINHKKNNKIQIIKNGIDTKYFKRKNTQYQKNTILFVGNMSYKPNVLAAKFICEKIFPLVKKEDSERLVKRYKFWQLFLEKLNTKSELFINISPNKYSWIGASSGVKAIQYNCAVKQSEARVEIYIDGGKGDDELTKKMNKEIFSELFKNKDQIEKDFGSKLDWNEKPDSRASTITKITDVGGWRDEEKWQEVHDELIEYVVGFERAFSHHVKNIKK